MSRPGIGRWLLGTAAALTAAGGFLADWNRMHLFNPRWPPHAKFHDAWTILLGTTLGSGGLYFLWRNGPDPELRLRLATLLPAAFWATQAGSFVFPGAGGLAAEFPDKVPTVVGVRVDERISSALMLLLIGTGYLLERPRLSRPIPSTHRSAA
jgi:hypothetical protein